jgi:hypothetical protein
LRREPARIGGLLAFAVVDDRLAFFATSKRRQRTISSRGGLHFTRLGKLFRQRGRGQQKSGPGKAASGSRRTEGSTAQFG